MTIWALADLHLSFGTPKKKMDIFGGKWINHAAKIEAGWIQVIKPEDLVLIAGDISWAMTIDEAKVDLEWIDALPGTKVMIKGNHDYWWSSLGKVKKILPSSCHVIQNDAFEWKGIAIGGARLWDTEEYGFENYIEFKKRQDAPQKMEAPPDPAEEERIFVRELQRLEMSLQAMNPAAKTKIVMTHYPPISATLEPSRVSSLLDKYGIDICLFGHLHNLKEGANLFGKRGGVTYYLTACDYLDFHPLQVL